MFKRKENLLLHPSSPPFKRWSPFWSSINDFSFTLKLLISLLPTCLILSFLNATGGCTSSFLSTRPIWQWVYWSFWDSFHGCLPAALELVWASAWAALLATGTPMHPTPSPPSAGFFFLGLCSFSIWNGSDSMSNNWFTWLVTMQRSLPVGAQPWLWLGGAFLHRLPWATLS